jgi:ribonuclease Z
LDDLAARHDRFQNKLIIASHLSTRYNQQQVERLVRRAFPDMLGGRLMLWLDE